MGYQNQVWCALDISLGLRFILRNLRTETRSPGTSSDEMTSTHLPSRKAWTLYGVMLIVLNSVKVRTRYSSASSAALAVYLTWKTTVHSKTTSMNAVKSE